MKIEPLQTTQQVGRAFLQAMNKSDAKPSMVRMRCRCGRPAIVVRCHEGVCAFCSKAEKVSRHVRDIDQIRKKRWVV